MPTSSKISGASRRPGTSKSCNNMHSRITSSIGYSAPMICSTGDVPTALQVGSTTSSQSARPAAMVTMAASMRLSASRWPIRKRKRRRHATIRAI